MQVQDKTKEKSETEQNPKVTSNPIAHWPTGLIISGKEAISVSVAEDLSVILTKNAFEQLFGWAYSTSREISCLGSVKQDGNRFIIEQFYLLKQSGSSVGTELDQTSMAELMERLIAEGKREEAGRIKCWAHSHPNMDAFWSNIDDDTCRLLVNDYLVSIVVGNNFAIRCRLDIAVPVQVVFDNLPVLYEVPKDDLQLAKYAQEVRATVSEKVLTFTKTGQQAGKVQDKSLPIAYCDYCGYCHAEGDCPLGDPRSWPQVPDEDYLPF